jgi:hypothetical protein
LYSSLYVVPYGTVLNGYSKVHVRLRVGGPLKKALLLISVKALDNFRYFLALEKIYLPQKQYETCIMCDKFGKVD